MVRVVRTTGQRLVHKKKKKKRSSHCRRDIETWLLTEATRSGEHATGSMPKAGALVSQEGEGPHISTVINSQHQERRREYFNMSPR